MPHAVKKIPVDFTRLTDLESRFLNFLEAEVEKLENDPSYIGVVAQAAGAKIFKKYAHGVDYLS